MEPRAAAVITKASVEHLSTAGVLESSVEQTSTAGVVKSSLEPWAAVGVVKSSLEPWAAVGVVKSSAVPCTVAVTVESSAVHKSTAGGARVSKMAMSTTCAVKSCFALRVVTHTYGLQMERDRLTDSPTGYNENILRIEEFLKFASDATLKECSILAASSVELMMDSDGSFCVTVANCSFFIIIGGAMLGVGHFVSSGSIVEADPVSRGLVARLETRVQFVDFYYESSSERSTDCKTNHPPAGCAEWPPLVARDTCSNRLDVSVIGSCVELPPWATCERKSAYHPGGHDPQGCAASYVSVVDDADISTISEIFPEGGACPRLVSIWPRLEHDEWNDVLEARESLELPLESRKQHMKAQRVEGMYDNSLLVGARWSYWYERACYSLVVLDSWQFELLM